MEAVTGRGLPRAMVDDVFLAPVYINAGGTLYTTTLNTLTKYPESKLAKLFNGTLSISIDPVNRQYFLDVNGSVFVHILDFLRYGELLIPDGFTQVPLLTKLANFFELQEMLESLAELIGQENCLRQNESDEDNSAACRRKRKSKKINTAEKNTNLNEGNNIADASDKNNIGKKDISNDTIKPESLDIEMIKSKISELGKVEASSVETDIMNTNKIEVNAIKSAVAEVASIGAVNVEMSSVDAGSVKTQSLEVGTLMAKALEVGTLKVGSMETETISGPVNVVLVRYDEYYKVIDIYSPDELTLLNPMFPHQLIRSEYVGNCNRLYYTFAELPCDNPHTKYKFGVPYLLHFFKQLLNKGYQFSSVITAGELNYTRDYVLIRFPSSNTRP